MTTNLTKRIAVIGIMSGVFFVLDRYIRIEFLNFKLSLSAIPIILVSFLYGTGDGMLTGAIGGFLSQLLSEYGLTITTPLWILPSVFRGLICGFGKEGSKKKQIFLIILSSIAVTIINTAVMIADAKIFKYDTQALELAMLITRLISGIGCAIVYSLIIPPVVAKLKK